jgi:hypothetical protein
MDFKCIDNCVFQLEYKICIWPSGCINEGTTENELDSFLMGVIGHNVEMIVNSEAKKNGAVNISKRR